MDQELMPHVLGGLAGSWAWNDVTAAILNAWRHINIRLRQSMRIYLKNNSILPNFIPIQFETTDRELGFKRSLYQEQEQHDE